MGLAVSTGQKQNEKTDVFKLLLTLKRICFYYME